MPQWNDRLAGEAGGLVYIAEEMPPLGAEYGTGGTKPPRLKHFCWGSWEGWVREAKRGGSLHCQSKQGPNWCGGTKWLWRSLGAQEGQLEDRNWKQGLTHGGGNTIHNSRAMGLSDHLLLLSVFTCQAFTCHTVSLTPRPAVLFWVPHSLKAPHTRTKLLQASLGLYNPIHRVHLHPMNHWTRPAPCHVTKPTWRPILGQVMMLCHTLERKKDE